MPGMIAAIQPALFDTARPRRARRSRGHGHVRSRRKGVRARSFRHDRNLDQNGWIDLIDSKLPAAKGIDPDFTLDAIGNRSNQRLGESVAVAYRYGKTNLGHPSVPRNHHQNGLCGRLGSLLVLANHRCANAGSPQGISVKRNPASLAAKVWVFGVG